MSHSYCLEDWFKLLDAGMLGHFQPYDCVHKMLWFESFQVIPVSIFLAVQIGGAVYGLIWYWSFGFVKPLLLSYGSNIDWSFSTCFMG